jgi:hypothetical protein
MLNPFERKPAGKKKFTLPIVPSRPSRDSYLNNVFVENMDDAEDTEGEDTTRVGECSNSTKKIILPFWSFVFSDVHLRDYVCVQVNLPSGICDKVHGLQDKVQATISACKTRLIVVCEWPETMCHSKCVEDALSCVWNDSTSRDGHSASTVSNMVQAFKKELHKIRVQNKVSKNCMLGSTCSIDLPFQVESDMVVCEPNWDRTVGSVTLYTVMKKMCKSTEICPNNCMAVRITRALGESKQTEYIKHSRACSNRMELNGSTDSEDSSTLDSLEALNLYYDSRKRARHN